MAELTGHLGFVTATAVSPDGRLAATGCFHPDFLIRVWDIETRSLVRTLEGHQASLRAVRFLVGGARILSASDDGTARLWDTATGAELKRYRTSDGTPQELCCCDGSADGRYIAGGTHGLEGYGAVLWSAETAQILQRVKHKNAVRLVRFAGDRWVSAGGGKNVEIVTQPLAGGKGRRVVLKGHSRPVFAIDISPDALSLASAATCNDAVGVRVWDPGSGTEAAAVGKPGECVALAFSPDARRIAYNCSTDVVVFEES